MEKFRHQLTFDYPKHSLSLSIYRGRKREFTRKYTVPERNSETEQAYKGFDLISVVSVADILLAMTDSKNYDEFEKKLLDLKNNSTYP